MATYDVIVNGKVVQSFEAEDFWSKDDHYLFADRENNSVGSVVKVPGMAVKKVQKSGGGGY
jgi:hypothetical protein